MHIYLLAFKNFGLYCYYYYYLHILDFELFEVLDLIITIYLMSNTIYDQCLVFSTHLFKVVVIYSYHLTPSFLTFKRLWKTDIEKISIKFEAMQSWYTYQRNDGNDAMFKYLYHLLTSISEKLNFLYLCSSHHSLCSDYHPVLFFCTSDWKL